MRQSRLPQSIPVNWHIVVITADRRQTLFHASTGSIRWSTSPTRDLIRMCAERPHVRTSEHTTEDRHRIPRWALDTDDVTPRSKHNGYTHRANAKPLSAGSSQPGGTGSGSGFAASTT